MASHEHSVLFICLGNICRSPIAEAVFNKLLNDRGLTDKWLVDSAAISSWHVGSKSDPRALSVLKSKGIRTDHSVRQIQQSDFNKFEYILGMDKDNLSELNHIAPREAKGKIELLGSYDPMGKLIIVDPYYERKDIAFKTTLDHCSRACEGFLNAIYSKDS